MQIFVCHPKPIETDSGGEPRNVLTSLSGKSDAYLSWRTTRMELAFIKPFTILFCKKTNGLL